MAEKLGVKLAGVTVTKISGHNARFIIKSGIGPGAIIGIIRSGEVIPKVVNVLRKAKKPSTPSDAGFEWEWNANKVEAVQTSSKDNNTTQVRATAHFFKAGLQVDDLGEGVVGQLYEVGYDSVEKIIRARASDLAKLEGWQQRKAEKIVGNIQQACQNADLVKCMAGSGILGPLLGERKLTALQAVRPKLFDLEASHTEKQIGIELKDVPGFSYKSSAPIIANLSKCLTWLSRLPITYKAPATIKVTGRKMAGQAVCFTGVRSKAAEEAIVAQGGSIASGVTSKTTMLVAKDPNDGSSKLVKARELGIKILSLGQLNKLLGI